MIQICSGSVWIIKVSYHHHWKWKVVAGLPEWSANQYFWGQLSREDCYHHRTNGHHLQGFCYDRLQIWGGMISLHTIKTYSFCISIHLLQTFSFLYVHTFFLQAWISRFEIKICLQTQYQCLYLDKTKPDFSHRARIHTYIQYTCKGNLYHWTVWGEFSAIFLLMLSLMRLLLLVLCKYCDWNL